MDAIAAARRRAGFGKANAVTLAESTGALSHGIATLGMANQLPSAPANLDTFSVARWTMLEQGLHAK